MSLRTTNLNLLPILRCLLKEGSVSRAAVELNLSQPATSNALNRLRTLLGDPLMIKVGREMRLSPKARQMRPLLDEVCSKIDALLHEAPFDPRATDRTFVVEGPDYIELLLGAPLIKIFADAAPLAAVNFTHADGSFRDRLGSGVVDIAILAWDRRSARGFSQMHGYFDRMVGVVRSGHPLALRPPKTASALAAYPQVGVEGGLRARGAHTSIHHAMRPLQGHTPLGAQSFLLLPLLASQTDCVAIVPKALADQVGDMARITSFELPGDSIVIDVGILWSPLYEADPAHRWFRDLIDRVLRQHFEVSGARRR